MRSSLNIFLFISFHVLFLHSKNVHPLLLSSSSETMLFENHSIPNGYLTFLGDSHLLQQGMIALTNEVSPIDAPKSAGVVLYNRPILLLDRDSKKVPSFSTMFSFTIENTFGGGEGFGDGLAFLISPDNDILGSPGYLGLVDSIDRSRNNFVAIEFDTRCDSMFRDPDDNHVGLDINNLFSVKFATASSLGMDLKSGDLIKSWIDYRSDQKTLEVFLSYSYLKPKIPVLKVDIDLSNYIKENMFVGFSAATVGTTQLTHIEKWEFNVMELNAPPPPSHSDSGITFSNPAESGHRHSHLSRFAIVLIVGVFTVPLVVLLGWFCWKKLIEMIQKSEGTNNVEMQNIRSTGGISYHEILISILVNEVARHRSLNIEKVLNRDAELIGVRTAKSSIPLCNRLPAVKANTLPPRNGLPLRTNDVTSV